MDSQAQTVPSAKTVKKTVGLNAAIPPGSNGNTELKNLLDNYQKYCAGQNTPFPLCLNAFSYMLAESDALGRPFDANKITQAPSSLNNDLFTLNTTTYEEFKKKFEKTEVSLDLLRYDEISLGEIEKAFYALPLIKSLNDADGDLAKFFNWCDQQSPKPSFLNDDLKQLIKQSLTAGIGTNLGHAFVQEHGKTGQNGFIGNFMEKVLLEMPAILIIVEEKAKHKDYEGVNPKRIRGMLLKEEMIKRVTEDHKFPLNMHQFKDFLSAQCPENQGKDGLKINDDNGFLLKVEDQLAALEIHPHFMMMEKNQKNKILEDFLDLCKKYRPGTKKEISDEINDIIEKIGTTDGFLSRHLKGNHGIINALEAVTVSVSSPNAPQKKNKNPINAILTPYLTDLENNDQGDSQRAKHVRAFLEQVKNMDDNPYWIIELMFYDDKDPLFKNTAIAKLAHNKHIIEDLKTTYDIYPKDLVIALQEGVKKYLMKILNYNLSDLNLYLQKLNEKYRAHPPEKIYSLTEELVSIATRLIEKPEEIALPRKVKKEKAKEEKKEMKSEKQKEKSETKQKQKSIENLAAKIKGYVKSKEFSDDLRNNNEFKIFYNTLLDRFNDVDAMKGKYNYSTKPRDMTATEVKSIEEMKGILSKLRKFISNEKYKKKYPGLDFDFFEIMKNRSGIYHSFGEIFPDKNVEALVIGIPENKRFNVQVDKIEDLWLKAVDSVIAQVAKRFPNASEDEVKSAIEHLFQNKDDVRADKNWNTASPSSSVSGASPASPSPTSTARTISSTSSPNLSPSSTQGSFANNSSSAMFGKRPNITTFEERIQNIIQDKNFPFTLVYKCGIEYGDFLREALNEKKTNGLLKNGFLEKIDNAKTPAEFFLLLMSSGIKQEISSSKNNKLFSKHKALCEKLMSLTQLAGEQYITKAADTLLDKLEKQNAPVVTASTSTAPTSTAQSQGAQPTPSSSASAQNPPQNNLPDNRMSRRFF